MEREVTTRIGAMKDYSEQNSVDEMIIIYDLSDEVLESAAVGVREKAGAFTLAFCSGLDTCPA